MFKKPLIIIGIALLACLIVAVIAFTVVLVIDMSHDDDFLPYHREEIYPNSALEGNLYMIDEAEKSLASLINQYDDKTELNYIEYLFYVDKPPRAWFTYSRNTDNNTRKTIKAEVDIETSVCDSLFIEWGDKKRVPLMFNGNPDSNLDVDVSTMYKEYIDSLGGADIKEAVYITVTNDKIYTNYY